MTTVNSARQQPAAARARALLHLRVTGRLALPDSTDIDLEPKDALLLAYLALEGPTPRGRLAALLWPDVDEERARGNLRQRLLRLKRTVGIELVVGNPLATLAPGVTHDLGEPHELLTAIELAYVDGFADWLETTRDRRRRVRIDLLDAALTRAENDGNLAEALEHANALLALDALSEHAHRHVIRLHYLRGDAAAALAAYERCRQVLKRELNAKPSAETDRLMANARQAVGAAPAVRQVPASVLRPPRLIGRERPWAVLQAAWDAKAQVAVLAEAGMGKTRLLADFAHAHGNALIVSARPGDERVVYAVVTRLLRAVPRDRLAALDAGVRHELSRLLPELGAAEPLRSEVERARFFNAVAAALAAQDEMFASIVVDDVHFADDASVELVQYLAAAGGPRWLFAARPAEIGAAARALLDGVSRTGQIIELSALTLPQIVALVESLDVLGLDAAVMAPLLVRRTGGNPLFVLETIKAWLTHGALPIDPAAARLPAVNQVGTLIERRIGRLSVEAVRLARCAAVAGQDFSAELAAHVLGVRPLDLVDAWAELETAQVFRGGAFAHDLIYEAALASVPAPIARELHREIARYLSNRNASAARLAEHWLAAGEERRAFEELMQAAHQARRQTLRLSEAASAYAQAADVAERLGDHDGAFDACQALCETYVSLDRARLDEALLDRLASHAATPDRMAQAQAMRAHVMLHLGRYAEAIPLAHRAAEQARAAGDEALATYCLADAAAAASQVGDADKAVRILRPLLPWTLEHASDDLKVLVLGQLAACLDNIDSQTEAQALHRRAIEAALRAGRHDEAIAAQGNLAVSYLDTGQPRAALAAIAEARRLGAGFDSIAGSTFAINMYETAALTALRHFGAALAASERALEDLRHHAIGAASVHVHRACLWVQLGQFARAQRECNAIDALAGAPAWLRARADQMLGRCAWSQGRRAEAARHWGSAAAHAPRTERAPLAAMIALDGALVEPAEQALADIQGVLRRAEVLGHHGSVLVARIRLAQVGLEAGDTALALRNVSEALQTSADVEPNDLYRGELWLVAAQLFRALGQARETARILREATQNIRGIADEQVPPEFRESFLSRNPINRELLRLATRVKS